jgi:hypothetical protein
MNDPKSTSSEAVIRGMIADYMRAHGLNDAEPERRIEEELKQVNFPFSLLLKLVQLRQQGHYLFPENTDVSHCYVLHVLGLNPLNPLWFDLPLPQVDCPELRFYCNSQFHDEEAFPHLTPLGVLTYLYVVERYTGLNGDVIQQRMASPTVLSAFVKDFNHFNVRRNNLRFVVDFTNWNTNKTGTLQQLVQYIHQQVCSAYPAYRKYAGFIAEVYQEVYLTAWLWGIEQYEMV